VISYQELLDVFWDSHNPARPTLSVQYKSAIFYHDEEQKRLALESKARLEADQNEIILTDILPYSRFYLAEDYHQKYYLRNMADLRKEMTAIYPDTNDFIASTAVARVNGYAGRNGDIEVLQQEIDSYGLSPAAKERLLSLLASEGQ
nr:peptide-methionine (S)-S-oxide reductase [Armatimonadota bacterium]NIO96224.1 peptide-methionine (S)-S-oxide reductase [Armatimonadota bacterium]